MLSVLFKSHHHSNTSYSSFFVLKSLHNIAQLELSAAAICASYRQRDGRGSVTHNDNSLPTLRFTLNNTQHRILAYETTDYQIEFIDICVMG